MQVTMESDGGALSLLTTPAELRALADQLERQERFTVTVRAVDVDEEVELTFEPPTDEGATAPKCTVCGVSIELADPDDPESYVHAEDGDWSDHSAQFD